jgi:hypothetical protein
MAGFLAATFLALAGVGAGDAAWQATPITVIVLDPPQELTVDMQLGTNGFKDFIGLTASRQARAEELLPTYAERLATIGVRDGAYRWAMETLSVQPWANRASITRVDAALVPNDAARTRLAALTGSEIVIFLRNAAFLDASVRYVDQLAELNIYRRKSAGDMALECHTFLAGRAGPFDGRNGKNPGKTPKDFIKVRLDMWVADDGAMLNQHLPVARAMLAGKLLAHLAEHAEMLNGKEPQ